MPALPLQSGSFFMGEDCKNCGGGGGSKERRGNSVRQSIVGKQGPAHATVSPSLATTLSVVSEPDYYLGVEPNYFRGSIFVLFAAADDS